MVGPVNIVVPLDAIAMVAIYIREASISFEYRVIFATGVCFRYDGAKTKTARTTFGCSSMTAVEDAALAAAPPQSGSCRTAVG
jgi:hypothetical protein